MDSDIADSSWSQS